MSENVESALYISQTDDVFITKILLKPPSFYIKYLEESKYSRDLSHEFIKHVNMWKGCLLSVPGLFIPTLNSTIALVYRNWS